MKHLFLMGLIALGLGSAAAQDETVTIGYVLWDSEIAATHVLAAVIHDELGYEVDLVAVDAGPMFIGLAQGDMDISVSVGLPVTHANYWDVYGEDLVDLGRNLDGATLGFVVPDYVTIDSITELNDHIDEFDGEIIGIDPGAGLMGLSEEALDLYGLNYDLIDGSDPAMVAALDRAISREEWVVVTGWEPHWKWVVYGIKYLEDPEGIFGEAQGVNTVLNHEFAQNGPEDVLALADAFYWTPDQMGTVMLAINQEGMEPWDAARQWIADNPEVVQGWLE